MRRRTNSNDYVSGIVPQLQNAISSEQFEDVHIYALFLNAMYTSRSKLDLGAKYLDEMSLMIKPAENQRRRSGDDITKSPLIGLVLRAAISLINRVPVQNQYVPEVDFPLLKQTPKNPGWMILPREGIKRRWLEPGTS
jgi:hypothetical protein